MHKKFNIVKAILFDFDGTLADTSLDMINSLNVVLKRNKYEKVKHFECKDYVSKGANGVVGYSSIINRFFKAIFIKSMPGDIFI